MDLSPFQTLSSLHERAVLVAARGGVHVVGGWVASGGGGRAGWALGRGAAEHLREGAGWAAGDLEQADR